MTTTELEPAMADTTYEQRLLDRIDELEAEKADRLALIDDQMRSMIRQRDDNKEMRSALVVLVASIEAISRHMPAYSMSEALNNARRIIEQTKSEGE